MITSIKENISKVLAKDDIHEFKPLLLEIEDEPISPLGSFLFWVIICFVVIAVLWLVFAKVDVVVTARGSVVPVGHSKIIQPLDKGIIKNILVKEGQEVIKGETLIEIDPTSLFSNKQALKTQLENKLLEIQRLNSLASGNIFTPNLKADYNSLSIQKNIYKESVNSIKKQLSIKEEELNKINEQISAQEEQMRTNNALLESFMDKEKRYSKVLDLITILQYQEVLDSIKRYQSQIKQNSFEINTLENKRKQVLEEINYIRSEFKNKHLKQLFESINEAQSLKAQLKEVDFKNQKQLIKSPVDGFVDKLYIHTLGGVVTPAQNLVSITPKDSPVYIKAKVLNKDAGFIKSDMPVKIKIDTFNFQKYGILKGKVRYISKNSLEDKDLGEIYEVIIEPLNDSLKVNGKLEKIRPGLSLRAEINTDKRRIVDFFIYPLIKYLDEGISVR